MSFLLVLLALVTATVGALGGLGGAVILVPLLVITGTPAREAAPLGLLSVAFHPLFRTNGQVFACYSTGTNFYPTGFTGHKTDPIRGVRRASNRCGARARRPGRTG